LPFDDFIDLTDDLSFSDLEKLEKQAEKTIKNLEKAKRKAGPVLPKGRTVPITGSGPLSNLPVGSADKDAQKLQKKIDRNYERLTKKLQKDTVKNFGKDKQGIAKQIFGDNIGKTLFSIGKNPQSFITNTIIGAAGVGFVLQITDAVIKEISRLDSFFKKFIDRIDDRVDQLRNKQTQAEIAAGLSQIIITTESGNVEARDAYNTFNEFNNNRAKLEEDYSIRNTSGYE